MLESLTLKNFQVHKNRTIELDPQTTTIIGITDSGKSSITRGLKWGSRNKPLGSDFINWDAEETTVVIKAEGRVVRRRRGKKKGSDNTYELDKEEYKAFGSGEVPPAIHEVLNIGEINFQGQHDSPFWFTKTAGEVSRELNRIVNLTKIDTTLSALASLLLTTRTEVKVSSERLQSAKEERTRLKYSRQMDKDLRIVEGKAEKLRELSHKRALLASVLSKVTEAQKVVYHSAGITERLQIVVEKGEAWLAVRKKARNLASLLESAKTAKIAAEQPVPDITDLLELNEKILRKNQSVAQLSAIVLQATTAKEKVCQKEERLKVLDQKFKKLIKDGCPLCGGLIPQ